MPSVRVLAVGDLMLDRFQYGKVERMSPEAPVPIFKPRHVVEMLGGVGNVAANLAALGCDVKLLARGGGGAYVRNVKRMLRDKKIGASLYGGVKEPVTIKTRLVAGHNHLLRIDEENIVELSPAMGVSVLADFQKHLDAADIVVLSDYGKGFLSADLTARLIVACRRMKRPVVVDPKGCDWRKYAGATLVKPNLKEFSEVAGRSFDLQAASFRKEVTEAAGIVLTRFDLGGLLITLSEKGMLYVPKEKSQEGVMYLPTTAREVFDVSGAGDTSLAALAAALGAGATMGEAMRIANAAAGVVVGKLGTATVEFEELKSALARESFSPSQKILDVNPLKKILDLQKQQGKKIGFTNGCFDCCHLGHLSSLKQARQLCDILVVGVNSDKWIRAHKGPARPIQDEVTRTQLLASLECVDYVVVFDDETALPLVKKLRPQVIAKEGYDLADWPEGRFIRSIGGQAVTLKRVDGYSTSSLVAKIGR